MSVKNPSNNAMLGRTDGYVHKKKIFTDIDIVSYGLDLQAVPIEDGSGAHIPKKVPVITDTYKMKKTIQQRAKGNDFESILRRVGVTGDLSLINQKKAIYGDSFKYPTTLDKALNLAVENDKKLGSLTQEKVVALSKFAKMSREELVNYVTNLENKKLANKNPGSPNPGSKE